MKNKAVRRNDIVNELVRKFHSNFHIYYNDADRLATEIKKHIKRVGISKRKGGEIWYSLEV